MTTMTPDALQLPYLTNSIPAIGGAIKRRYEDFRVTEIPAYEPCGEGTHTFFRIEKAGLSTMQAVSDIARALGVATRQIGLAGLKDARAVTRQWLSVEHVDPQRVCGLKIPRIRILDASRHTNKLKIGHLRGNRFAIRLRDVDPGRIDDIDVVLETLSRRGVPNYFGSQRFGSRGDTWEIGRAIIRRDFATALGLMLGRAGPHDHGRVLRARQLYDTGDYTGAAGAWPYMFRDNARACRVLAKSGGRHERAYHAIEARLRKFFVNAYQSHLFNQCLIQRLDGFDTVVPGDLAYKHDNGAVFPVEDAEADAARAAGFEISPTGPIFGGRMTRATGDPGQIEETILADEQLTIDAFGGIKGVKVHGSRRPFRFALRELAVEAGSDEAGPYVELAFALDAGCYATMILREICKASLSEGLSEGESSGTAD